MHFIRDGKVYKNGKLTKTTVEHGITYDEDDEIVIFKSLNFATFADFGNQEPKDWLIEGVIALNEDSTWFGRDGQGKSTVIDDIAIHIASKRDWRGYKFAPGSEPNEEIPNGVLIFATERAALHRRRLEAYKKRDSLPDDLPIAVCPDPVNLCDPACVESVSDTIFEFERQNRCAVGLVVFDSWAKAMGGCDENLAATQTYACAHLGKIRDRYSSSNYHFLTVGHSGKDGKKEERGNSAKRAHMDLAVYINKGTAEIVKANDVPVGELATFEPEDFTVTRPAFVVGERTIPERSFTVSILSPHKPDQTATEARPADSRLTPKQTQALDALKCVIASHGQDGAVHVDYWKEELTKAGLLKSDAKNPWQPFKRIKDALTQQIIEMDGQVRLKIPPPPIPLALPSHSHP
ncbi:AAA family ATPase [Bradyrhizobium sp. dw_411]|uniref:AAA family ATPase n=1 Tax=Bradyrhizobium sp. dw_411 TaxID=2720082 RepID=UPI001BD093D0|nr:AAA family ATPase [Bradyrhizobium sp. dw_411]